MSSWDNADSKRYERQRQQEAAEAKRNQWMQEAWGTYRGRLEYIMSQLHQRMKSREKVEVTHLTVDHSVQIWFSTGYRSSYMIHLQYPVPNVHKPFELVETGEHSDNRHVEADTIEEFERKIIDWWSKQP